MLAEQVLRDIKTEGNKNKKERKHTLVKLFNARLDRAYLTCQRD